MVDQANNSAAVLLGNGDGTFQTAVGYPVGGNGTSLITGDMNNDGNLDLLLVSTSDNTVSVLLGNGDGTFQEQKTTTTGYGPVAVTVGDLNGDGELDVIVAGNPVSDICMSGGAVEVLLGNGDGTLQAPQDYCLDTPIGGASPLAVAIGDFNGDGKLDVVTANEGVEGVYNISIFLGNGDGTLQANQFVWEYSISQPSSGIVTGDFNRDGKLDMAVSNVSNPDTAPEASSISILLGMGDGTFQAPVTYGLPNNTNPASILVADFDGDGKADLAIPSGNGGQEGGAPFENLGPLSAIYIFLGNGDGTFQVQEGYSPAANNVGEAVALAVGDFNGDGKPDLVSLGPAPDQPSY